MRKQVQVQAPVELEHQATGHRLTRERDELQKTTPSTMELRSSRTWMITKMIMKTLINQSHHRSRRRCWHALTMQRTHSITAQRESLEVTLNARQERVSRRSVMLSE